MIEMAMDHLIIDLGWAFVWWLTRNQKAQIGRTHKLRTRFESMIQTSRCSIGFQFRSSQLSESESEGFIICSILSLLFGSSN